MSNYHTNFYRTDSNTKTLLTDSDYHSFHLPCKTTFIYGSGSKNLSLGIPMEEVLQSSSSGSNDHGGYVKRVLPCSCLIYSLRGETPQSYTNYDQIYNDRIDDDEFCEDISCGEGASAFLTSKGRVFTSANSANHDASEIPTFIHLNYSDPKQNINSGMVVELNLETVAKQEKEYVSYNQQEQGYAFGVKQVCVLSTHLCIVTKFGLAWLLTQKDNWILLKFYNKSKELARIKYVTSGLSHLMALSEGGEVFSASQYDTYGACGNGNARSGASFEINTAIIPLQNGDSVLDIYAAYYRTLIVTKFGKLYVSGWGVFNQQAIGHAENILNFTLHSPMEEAGEKVIKVALGALHTICLCESGNCWALGYNSYKQCGIKTESDNIPLPQIIPLPKKIKNIFCGWHFSILQTIDGEFLGSGANSSGELSSIKLDDASNVEHFTPLKLPKPPVDNSQIVWRIYTCSFSSNIFYMGRLSLSKRIQWMQHNFNTLSRQPLLSDITILH